MTDVVEQDWGFRFRDLTESDAASVVAFGEEIGFEGFTCDPTHSYEWLLSRNDVLLVQKLIEIALARNNGEFLNRERWGGESLWHETSDWLSVADGTEHPIPNVISRMPHAPYSWGIKLIELTEQGAARVASFALARSLTFVVIDPSKWLEFSMDRASVEINRVLILGALDSHGSLSGDERTRSEAILREMDSWLAQSVPVCWD